MKFFVFLFMRLQYPRRGAAGPANVTVKEENPRRSFPPLALALQWCEDWTACQVRCDIKYNQHLRRNNSFNIDFNILTLKLFTSFKFAIKFKTNQPVASNLLFFAQI